MLKAKTKKTPQEYAAEINGELATVSDYLKRGQLCAEAKNVLNEDEQRILLDELKGRMSKGNFSKYVMIGNQSNRLSKIEDKLPPNYTTLYQLAKWEPAKLEKAVSGGLVHPSVTREEVLAMTSEKPKPPSDFLGKLSMDGCPEQTRLEVTKAIKALAAKYEGQVGLKLPAAVKTAELKEAA